MRIPPGTGNLFRAALREVARQYTGPIRDYRRAIVGTWKWTTLAGTLVIALAATGVFGQDLNPGPWGSIAMAATLSIVFGLTAYAWAYIAFQCKEEIRKIRDRHKTGAGHKE